MSSHLWAYLDPGSGSFLLQILFAGLLAGIYFVKRTWYGLKAKILPGNTDE